VLPSVSTLCRECGLAKATVIQTYAILQERGIVNAVHSKGYFVATESVDYIANVMLLFDEFPAYKQVLYENFIETLCGKAQVNIYFHHCIPTLFESLLLDKIRYYDLALVMPFANETVGKILGQVDPDKILILDRADYAGKGISFIGQEFKENVYNCLESASGLLSKYKRLYLVFPPQAEVAIKSSQAPREIIDDFRKFYRKNKVAFKIPHATSELPFNRGDAVFLIDDADLVVAVETAREKNLKLGEDVGILSYNDTPMKRVVYKGITVISTDFGELGRRAAHFVLERKPVHEIIPTTLIRRNSL
jgi:hypothetical protein